MCIMMYIHKVFTHTKVITGGVYKNIYIYTDVKPALFIGIYISYYDILADMTHSNHFNGFSLNIFSIHFKLLKNVSLMCFIC